MSIPLNTFQRSRADRAREILAACDRGGVEAVVALSGQALSKTPGMNEAYAAGVLLHQVRALLEVIGELTGEKSRDSRATAATVADTLEDMIGTVDDNTTAVNGLTTAVKALVHRVIVVEAAFEAGAESARMNRTTDQTTDQSPIA